MNPEAEELSKRRYGYWRALWMAAYSRDLYRDVATRWPGIGLSYLWLLLLVVWTPELLKIHFDLAADVDKYGESLAVQFPDIAIRNGVAIVTPSGIHTIRNPADGQVVMIIDTTGEHQTLEGTGAAILVTESTVHLYREQRGETRIYDLARFEGIVDRINPDVVRKWASVARNGLIFLLFVLLVPFSFLYRLVQILFYSALAMPFARRASVALGFSAVLRITTVAITVPVVLETMRSILNVEIPLWWLICFAIATAYIHFGLNAVAGAPPAAAPPQSEAGIPGTIAGV